MHTANTPVHADAVSPPAQSADMLEHAREATRFLKALAHEGRLMILCMLVEGERSVSELGDMLGAPQPIVSQQLARLRADDFVATRRQGKNVYYSLANEEVREVVTLLYRLFCEAEAGPARPS
ncbi:MAG: metalloregulator ArsR/SmtB family transcription factor [Halofilum sp. (in: g-proteobacteria)]|nr:metalloregulator ArsR/SmtB family transcription factor [Halofilum sp. (in: g-proteobacteria)]